MGSTTTGRGGGGLFSAVMSSAGCGCPGRLEVKCGREVARYLAHLSIEEEWLLVSFWCRGGRRSTLPEKFPVSKADPVMRIRNCLTSVTMPTLSQRRGKGPV